MVLQHSDCVERAVMRVLQKRFSTKLRFADDKAYALFDIDPSLYSSPVDFKLDYIIVNFLRKWKGLDTKIDLKTATFGGWISSEYQCFRTNKRLFIESSTGNYSVPPNIISDAQRKITDVLGRFSFDRIEQLCRFGKGATQDIRHGSNIADKMLSEMTVTHDCIPFVCKLLANDDVWNNGEVTLASLNIVDSNRMVMVPKNSKTHRMIAAEPTLNSFVQQSVGRFIRMRLKKFGIDLDDQTINQDLAFRSLADGLSTIDLSNASDTLSINLVKLLLPHDWFTALDAMRCGKSTFDGKKYLLSKFSSMGNAFTFELETLIFWALTSSSSKNEGDVVSVYGDDIVVTNENFAQTKLTLEWAGFLFNNAKSFTFPSRFYESCGKHFFDLEDVTPTFQKDVCSRPFDFIRLHNRLVRLGIRLDLSNEVIDACRVVRDYYARSFPKLPLVLGPNVEGDRFFIDPKFVWPAKDVIKVACLIEKTSFLNSTDLEEQAFYAYKLRQRSSYSNVSPLGYSVRIRSTKWVFKNSLIWRSSFLGS